MKSHRFDLVKKSAMTLIVALVSSLLSTEVVRGGVDFLSPNIGVDCVGLDCSELVRLFDFNMGTGSDSIHTSVGMRPNVSGSRECQEGLIDPVCATAEDLISAHSLSICDSLMSFDCVESLRMILPDGEVVPGNVLGSVNAIPLPGGGVQALGPWVPDLLVQFATPDNGVETYQFNFRVSYLLMRRKPGSEQFLVRGFWGGGFSVAQIERTSRVGVNQNPYRCIPIDSQLCWSRKSDGILRRFGFSIRRDEYPSLHKGGWGTWKSASLGDPQIKLEVLSSGPRRFRMQVEASQIEIPGVSAEFAWSNIEERNTWTKIDESLRAVDRWESRPWCGGPKEIGLVACPQLRGTFVPHTRLVYPNGMYVPDAYDLFRTILSHDSRFNSAEEVIERFSLGEQPPWNVSWGNCPLQDYFGFSTSNALALKNGFPSWDSSSESVVLDVVAPHYRPNGSVFKGTYSLVIPIELATCLWGGDVKNSLKVEMSVVDQDGVSNTVIVNSSLNGNLFTFTAKGFTYSAKRIVIKPVLSKSSPSPKVFAVKCRKGKSTKIFVKVNKTCPPNWVRVSVRRTD